MDKITNKLEEIQNLNKKIWEENNIEQMSLSNIDYLCLAVEDGMDAKKALKLIYRFAHSASHSICFDVHEDWRTEVKEFFYKTNIKELK